MIPENKNPRLHKRPRIQPKKKAPDNGNVSIFQVCKDEKIKLTDDQLNYLGFLARQAWNLISPTPPIKAKCKQGFRVNTFPIEFKPVIVNCVRILLQEEIDKARAEAGDA